VESEKLPHQTAVFLFLTPRQRSFETMGTNLQPLVEDPQMEQSGQVEPSAEVSEGEPVNDEQQQYVSKSELMQMFEEFTRKTQGLVDKNVGRLDKRVSEAMSKVEGSIEVLKSTGMTFTPEQEAQLRNKAMNDALMAKETPQTSQAAPAQVQTEGAGQVDPITAAARLIMSKNGVNFKDGDPEISLIDTTTEDPEAYLDSVKAAVKAYKERQTKPKTQAGAPSAVGKGSGVLAPNADQYISEMIAAKGKPEEIRTIKEKYRKAGLAVDTISLFKGSR
jgi:hypothetical protein